MAKANVLSLSATDLAAFVCQQVNTLIPDPRPISLGDIRGVLDDVLDKVFFCFSKIALPYYKQDGAAYFNHLHSDHHCVLLYLLSRYFFEKKENEDIAVKFFLLNKYLFGIDLYYKVKLPDVFIFVHPVGSVIGNASFKNNVVFYQNVTIGSDIEGGYPVFGADTIFFAKSAVIGNCHCGPDTVFGANTFVINTNIPANSVVVGTFPDHIIRHNSGGMRQHFFGQ